VYEQQLPVKSNFSKPVHDDVLDSLVKYFVDRKALGIERYGQALHTFNNRDSARDSIEEALDLIVYLHQFFAENRILMGILRELLEVYILPDTAGAIYTNSGPLCTYCGQNTPLHTETCPIPQWRTLYSMLFIKGVFADVHYAVSV
jgi:hypothetical protein